jgi:hypothetical protein
MDQNKTLRVLVRLGGADGKFEPDSNVSDISNKEKLTI